MRKDLFVSRRCVFSLLLVYLCLSGLQCEDSTSGGSTSTNTDTTNTDTTNTEHKDGGSYNTDMNDSGFNDTNMTEMEATFLFDMGLDMSNFSFPNITPEMMLTKEGMDQIKAACVQLKTYMDKLKEYASQHSSTNEMLKTTLTEMESNYPALCNEMINFKYSTLTTERAIGMIGMMHNDPKAMLEFSQKLNTDTLKGVLQFAVQHHWLQHPELKVVVTAMGAQFIRSIGSGRLTVDIIKEMGNSALMLIPPNQINYLSETVFEYLLDQIANVSETMIATMTQGMHEDRNHETEYSDGTQQQYDGTQTQTDGTQTQTDGTQTQTDGTQTQTDGTQTQYDGSQYDTKQDDGSSTNTQYDGSNTQYDGSNTQYDGSQTYNNTENQGGTEDSTGGPMGMQVNLSMFPMYMIATDDGVRLKAICQRAFRMYHTSWKLNSAKGWPRLKYMMFCAPASVCKKINPPLIKEALTMLSVMPWGCGQTVQIIMEDQSSSSEGEQTFKKILQEGPRLFPSSRSCGTSLLSKVVISQAEGYDPLLNVTNIEALKKLQYFSVCMPDQTMISLIQSNNCSLGKEILDFQLFNQRVNNYAAQKCLKPPENVENITCSNLGHQFGPFLAVMKMNFFHQLSKDVLCNQSCIQTFKNRGVRPNAMDFIVDTCYGKDTPITSDVVDNLGAMVTDLPVETFDQITAADLEKNLDSIKQGLKETQGGGRSKKRAVMGKLARKMISDGKLSAITDSKEIMKQVSLKELKSSLSTSTNLLTDLGINNASSDVAMTDSQKKWVVKELLKQKSSDAMTLEDISGMSGLVTGLLSSDIKAIGLSDKNDTQLLEFASVMCGYNNWPTKSLKAINTHLINKALQLRNSTHPMTSLTTIDVDDIGCECFMHFSAEDLGVMSRDVCSGVCQKIGYCSNFRCLNERRRKNTLQACLKCKGLGANPMTDADIDELGPSLISQMSKQQIDLIPNTVLANHLQFFKEMCMNQVLRDAVSVAIPRVIGSYGSAYTADVLYSLGGAIKLLPASIQQGLDENILAEMSSSILSDLMPTEDTAVKLKMCCERWLPVEDLSDLSQRDFTLMLTLKNAMFTQAASDIVSRRRRRSTSSWTCSFIRQSPMLFYTATETEINDMADTEFVECLTDIGQLPDYTTSQKTALLAKAKTALNEADICNMAVSDVISLGSILTSLTVEELGCLPLNDSSLLTSIGTTSGWSTPQLTSIATQYLTSNSLTDLTGLTETDIGVLGPVLCGFSAGNIATIQAVEIGKSGTVIGALQCDITILSEFATLAVHVDAFGPVSGWTAAEVSELNYLIAGLSGVDIVSLTVSALEGLNAAVIPVIPDTVLKEMTTTQLESFTDAQAAAVTDTQLAAMDEAQTTILSSQSTGGLDEVPELQMADDNPDSGTDTVVFSPIHIALTLVGSVVITTLI